MAQKIFVNLPVKDVRKSMDFFDKLGFKFNPQFTDHTAACMVISEDIYVMLLTENKFRTFTPKQICDATKSTEVLVCLSSESRDEGQRSGSQQDPGIRDRTHWAVVLMEPRTNYARMRSMAMAADGC